MKMLKIFQASTYLCLTIWHFFVIFIQSCLQFNHSTGLSVTTLTSIVKRW